MEDSRLLSILDRQEKQALAALFRFDDGEVYELRVVSTMHAEAGGDIVAEVVRVASSPHTGRIKAGEFINFSLSEVVHITVDGECVFLRVPDA